MSMGIVLMPNAVFGVIRALVHCDCDRDFYDTLIL